MKVKLYIDLSLLGYSDKGHICATANPGGNYLGMVRYELEVDLPDEHFIPTHTVKLGSSTPARVVFQKDRDESK